MSALAPLSAIEQTRSFTVPPLSDDSVAMMDALGRVAHLSQWARAAWVASLVGPAGQLKGRPKGDEITPFTPIKALARHGITGLKGPQQIRAYRDAWFAQRPADEYGIPQVGDHIDLTDLPDWGERPTKKIAPPPTDEPEPEPEPTKEDYMAKRAELVDHVRDKKTGHVPAMVIVDLIVEMGPPSEERAGFIAGAISRHWGNWSAFDRDRKADGITGRDNQRQIAAGLGLIK